ncbi:MAG: hypothetical protein JWR32_6780, partial [Mycobacterium sp.]|nr:hypothetical protein [Mycobacterium sp.]
RDDRYSELRGLSTVDLPKPEMSYLGGRYPAWRGHRARLPRRRPADICDSALMATMSSGKRVREPIPGGT